MKWIKLLIILSSPLALSGCLLAPGNFKSDLDVSRDGRFSFTYTGQIVVAGPRELMNRNAVSPVEALTDVDYVCYGEMEPKQKVDAETRKIFKRWEKTGGDACAEDRDKGRACWAADAAAAAAADAATAVAPASGGDMVTTTNAADAPDIVERRSIRSQMVARPCSTVEIADKKAERESVYKAAMMRQEEESQQIAAALGFDMSDEKAMAAFGAVMAKQAGWRSVSYQGQGIYNVDYAINGNLDRDFVFPVFPKGEIVFPFVIVRKRADGSVQVNAPAFVRGGAGGMLNRYGRLAGGMSQDSLANIKTSGIFTLTTNGNLLTNNTADGPTVTATGKALAWDVNGAEDRPPEALVGLK
jgi:hypothetical protein